MSYSKYHNKKTEIDGYTFDSLKEARRYQELCLLALAGEIQNLEVHKRFELHAYSLYHPYSPKVAEYEADFCYVENGSAVVEDTKGVKTAVYKLKRKWMKAEHGIEILET